MSDRRGALAAYMFGQIIAQGRTYLLPDGRMYALTDEDGRAKIMRHCVKMAGEFVALLEAFDA